MKDRIDKERIWLYFVLIPFFPLRGIMEFSRLFKQAMTGWLLVAIFFILVELCLYFRSIKNKKLHIDGNFLIVMGYFFLMLLITILVRKGLGEGLQKIIAAPFLCLLLLMYSKKKKMKLLDVLANIILFDVFANCTFLCPPIFRKLSGLSTTLIYSIGHVQTAAQIGLIGITLAIILKEEGNNRRNKILILFSVLTMATSITFVSDVILLFLLFCYVFRKQLLRILKNIRLSSVYFGMICLNIIVVLCVVHFRIDFAARCGVYTVAISEIMKKPLLGYGVEGIKIIPEWMRWNANAIGFNYAHNEVLQLLLDGGIVLLAAHLLLIKKTLDNSERMMSRREKYLFAVILTGFSVVAISESVTDYYYFWTFIFITFFSKRMLGRSLKETE